MKYPTLTKYTSPDRKFPLFIVDYDTSVYIANVTNVTNIPFFCHKLTCTSPQLLELERETHHDKT